MVLATVKYVDPTPLFDDQGNLQPHWSKVEGPFQSFDLLEREVWIENIQGRENEFDIDRTGFAMHHWPIRGERDEHAEGEEEDDDSSEEEDIFATDSTIRAKYYPTVEQLLHQTLPGRVRQIVIFDHTLRQMSPDSPRKPVLQVHIDQTLHAARLRIHKHLPPSEAASLLRGRFSLLNVWRPIGPHPAIEYPLALLDARTLRKEDLVHVDLLYPVTEAADNRGLEEIPAEEGLKTTEGYEVRGETYGVAPSLSGRHRFFYRKGLGGDWAVVFKCADSAGEVVEGKGEGEGEDDSEGIAACCAHTAFVDPETPDDAPRRRSIEVRCLVFFEDEKNDEEEK